MRIHVISFQVPYPADYGGVIDVYYKLLELREAGFSVALHTYAYDRDEQPHLNKVCDEVHYYKRERGWSKQLSLLPYIVNTRDDARLLDDLCKDEAPILFEGLHTCRLLTNPRLMNRRKFVRMHNIEHEYYWRLAMQDKWNWRSIYYIIESIRLRRFERVLCHADIICAITKADKQNLDRRFPGKEIIHLPCFFDTAFPTKEVETEPFVLYQGNLAVEENIHVVNYILHHIAPKLPNVLFVIAGRNPRFSKVPNNVKIFANPTDKMLDQLLNTARIHLMLTFQPTGIKLKLLNALVKGHGHIIANRAMLYGHSLGRYCVRADEAEQIINQIKQLIQEPLTSEEMEKRRSGLLKMKKARISRLSLFNRY